MHAFQAPLQTAQSAPKIRNARHKNTPTPLSPTSLAFALDSAACLLASVRDGQTLPTAFKTFFNAHPLCNTPGVRGAIQDVVYRTLRALGRADALLALLVPKKPLPHLAHLLTCALALLTQDKETAAYPPFTLVNEAVKAAGSHAETAFAKGFVNGVLRHFLREPARYLDIVLTQPVARWNYPQWWIDAMQAAWPDSPNWSDILEAGNTQAPLVLRINTRLICVQDYLQRLTEAGIQACTVAQEAENSPCHPQAVLLFQALPVDQLPGFAQGWFSVQDAGAQYAAVLLDAQPNMRVLDACAAPGGKTTHLAERDVQLIALDTDPQRLQLVRDNLQRLKMTEMTQVILGDAGNPNTWWDGQHFDRILADVPCSGSGIVRRHPDIRWLKRPTDIPALVAQQRRILTALWPLLKSGGRLLYVTCSIFPEEGEHQAQWFCSHYPAVRLDAPGQLLPTAYHRFAATDPPLCDHDGFFYALFEKQ